MHADSIRYTHEHANARTHPTKRHMIPYAHTQIRTHTRPKISLPCTQLRASSGPMIRLPDAVGTQQPPSAVLHLELGRAPGGRPQDPPEAESLIGSRRHYRRPVGALSHVQHPRLVARQLNHLVHPPSAGIPPQNQLVVGEAVRRHKLPIVNAPLDRTHLGLCVNLIQALPVAGVPQADPTVRRPPPRCQEVCLKGAPCKGLDRRLVAIDGKPARVPPRLPNVEHIVVAAARQLRRLGAPLQAAHLLRVPVQLPHPVLGGPYVVVHDYTVAGTRADRVAAPGEGGDAGAVARHGPEHPPSSHIPQLHLPIVRPNRERAAAWLLPPRQRSDNVAGLRRLEQLLGGVGRSVPQEDALPQRHREDVGLGPVEEVEVVVVYEVGGVEDLVGRLWDEARGALLLGGGDGRGGGGGRGARAEAGGRGHGGAEGEGAS
mmetsp:Transcript_8536/g.20995  ORF Transcript_8536/g.20995 Transcript_8536/m.20995 type:complete len:431 (-) Transcript_8536:602-1894(-)